MIVSLGEKRKYSRNISRKMTPARIIVSSESVYRWARTRITMIPAMKLTGTSVQIRAMITPRSLFVRPRLNPMWLLIIRISRKATANLKAGTMMYSYLP